MSEHSNAIARFRDAVTNDPALRAALEAADPTTGEEVVAFAAEHGYDFTASELDGVVGLGEKELDAVVGGGDYLKIGGVEGETKDKGHKDWINLLSVSQSMNPPMK